MEKVHLPRNDGKEQLQAMADVCRSPERKNAGNSDNRHNDGQRAPDARSLPRSRWLRGLHGALGGAEKAPYQRRRNILFAPDLIRIQFARGTDHQRVPFGMPRLEIARHVP